MVSTAPISVLLEELPVHQPPKKTKSKPYNYSYPSCHSQETIPGKDYKLIYNLNHSGKDQRTKFYICS